MFQLIQFTKEFSVSGANQEDEEFQFMPLGDVVEAVVLRLSTDLPRIRCETSSTEWRGLENVSR